MFSLIKFHTYLALNFFIAYIRNIQASSYNNAYKKRKKKHSKAHEIYFCAIKIFCSDVTKHETSSNHPSTLNHYNTYNKYSVSDHNIRKCKAGFPGMIMFYITFTMTRYIFQ